METKNIVTKEMIAENMKDVNVRVAEEYGKIVTDVTVTMKNGFTLHEGIVSNPEDYNKEADKAHCLRHIRHNIRLILKYTLYDQANKEKNAHKTFKPFQKVLVKVTNDDDNHVWVAAIYSHYNESKGRHYFSNLQWTDDDSGIIPFEGNEDKLGQIAE